MKVNGSIDMHLKFLLTDNVFDRFNLECPYQIHIELETILYSGFISPINVPDTKYFQIECARCRGIRLTITREKVHIMPCATRLQTLINRNYKNSYSELS